MVGKHKTDTKQTPGLLAKARPFMLPLLFMLGSVGAYFINAEELMSKDKGQSNVSPQNVFLVQILAYLGIIGFIYLGYFFQTLMDKREAMRLK